ncbi:MAG: hypothetical protein ACO22M_00625 [Candidatus Nanopelagicaceae bacterium]|jgi:hypothetical protein
MDIKEALENQPAPVKRGRGRPKKGEIVAKMPKKRGLVGRPKGEQSIINEYRARMLASPKSSKVLEKIYEAALNDEHKNQSAAWKLIMDRMLPLSYFEKSNNVAGRASVNITITGVNGDTTIIGNEEADDVQYVEKSNEF